MTEAEAAVAILHCSAADSVLLMRRSVRADDSWSGQWSLPGGRRETADADALGAALREAEEECGVCLSRSALRAELPSRHARRKAGAYVWVTPFVFHCADELPTTLDPREAAAAVWLPVATLRDAARHRLMPVPAMPPDMLYPGVELEGAPLWGFTYHLLMDWLGLAPPRQAGPEGAQAVLDAALEGGAALKSGWAPAEGRMIAEVAGPLPLERLRERFTGPGSGAVGVNCLHVGEERVRILGPAYEEYWIVRAAQ